MTLMLAGKMHETRVFIGRNSDVKGARQGLSI